MIAPSNNRPGITFEEAVAGYIADGMGQESAEVHAAMLLDPDAFNPVHFEGITLEGLKRSAREEAT